MNKKTKGLVITLVVLGSMFGSIFGVFFAMQAVLGTPIPVVVVTSGSMSPTILEGDLLIIQNVPAEDLQVGDHHTQSGGDIIVFDAPGYIEPIVHRIVNKTLINGTYYFETWGDNSFTNPIKDPWLTPEDRVHGKVILHLPYLGWPKLVLDRFNLALPIFIALAILLAISIAWDFLKPKNAKKGEEEEGIARKTALVKGIIIDMSNKFQRVSVTEILEQCEKKETGLELKEDFIISVLKDMLKASEVNGDYFESTRSIIFGFIHGDDLDKEFAAWDEREKTKDGKI